MNAELEYQLVQLGNERVILATELVQTVQNALGIEQIQILGSAKKVAFRTYRFNHPFYDFSVPMILGTITLPLMGGQV